MSLSRTQSQLCRSTPISSFVQCQVTKIKNTVPWAHVITGFNGEEIIVTFHEKELQKN